MEYDWARFVETNASAIFALIGALGGGILSFFGAMHLKRREFDLSVSGKILDRRIDAHERVISLANEMSVMVALGGLSEAGEVRRAPQIMHSRETFENWFTRFTQLSREGSSWLSTRSKREVNFVQDYLITLHINLEGVPTSKFLELGELIRQDFVDLSSSLEKCAFSFFQDGIRNLQPDSLDAWHKYERSETKRRLHATALAANYQLFFDAKA
jgi:hypothetical protein